MIDTDAAELAALLSELDRHGRNAEQSHREASASVEAMRAIADEIRHVIGGASRSGRVSDVPAEPVRQSDTASTVSDGAPIVRGAGDANGTFVAKTAGA